MNINIRYIDYILHIPHKLPLKSHIDWLAQHLAEHDFQKAKAALTDVPIVLLEEASACLWDTWKNMYVGELSSEDGHDDDEVYFSDAVEITEERALAIPEGLWESALLPAVMELVENLKQSDVESVEKDNA